MKAYLFIGLILLATNTIAEQFTITAYCNCRLCCGKWSEYHKTADGHVPQEGVTCAASRKIPFGTKLEIDGVGIRTVQDRLSPKFDEQHIDIYFNKHSDALKFGKKKLNVKRLIWKTKVSIEN